jgi:arginase
MCTPGSASWRIFAARASVSPGGLDPDELVALLAALAPAAVGAQVTVFDPDLDPDGHYADLLTDVLATGLGRLGRAASSPG